MVTRRHSLVFMVLLELADHLRGGLRTWRASSVGPVVESCQPPCPLGARKNHRVASFEAARLPALAKIGARGPLDNPS
jgi:hypothetical protein